MKVFVSGRRGGKTAAALEWLTESPSTRAIIYPSADQARNALHDACRLYPDVPLDERNFISANRAGSLRGLGRKYAVDNADQVLMALLGTMPELATITGDLVR